MPSSALSLSIEPTEDRIVVAPDEIRDDVTAAGLLVKVTQTVESDRHLGGTGTVIAVGPGKRGRDGKRIPLVVEPGQRIVFGEFQHKEHFEGPKRFLIMQEADVCGIIEQS
jgi:chaperonin GroES